MKGAPRDQGAWPLKVNARHTVALADLDPVTSPPGTVALADLESLVDCNIIYLTCILLLI